MKKTFISTKVYDGFSTCFRQWRADGTHCRFLHGYGVSFKVWFEGELDERNWVYDFGGFKRSKHTIDGMSPKNWLNYLLDHTVIVAEDDPHLGKFQRMAEAGIIQLRTMPNVGCEVFADYLLKKLDKFVREETDGRVKVIQLEFFEHGKNSAVATLDELEGADLES